MTNSPYLSICIPSYNHGNNIATLCNNIINANSNNTDFEIIITDNCSQEKDLQIIKSINDSRVTLIEHSNNIGGMVNIISAITHAKGTYILLCLDKDTIIPENLTQFINELKQHSDISVGQCKQDITKYTPHNLYTQGFDALNKFGYCCEHPSGTIINTKKLHESGIAETIINENRQFPFNIDIVKAHLAIMGNAIEYNAPLIINESATSSKNNVSNTYSRKNLFYSPDNVMIQLEAFLNDLQLLSMPNKEKRKMAMFTYKRNLYRSTIDYRTLMQNEATCAHYMINTEQIKLSELIKIHIKYIQTFWRIKNTISTFHKMNTILINLIKWSAKIILKK